MNNSHNSSKAENDNQFDIVVVSSGPAGIHAAYPLIKSGLNNF